MEWGKQGYKQDQKKWFGKNCIDKGTYKVMKNMALNNSGMM